MIMYITAALAAAAAVFAVLYFESRKNAEKLEGRSESLSREMNELRCVLARNEAVTGDALKTLTRDNIVEFIRKELTGEVGIDGDPDYVQFSFGGSRYHIDCRRLPQQFIIRKGYNMDGVRMRWAILERAACETMKKLIMVKINIQRGEFYDFMILSTTHTIAALRQDLNIFLQIIADAERQLYDEYWRIMNEEHPEDSADESQAAEDIAMNMAGMTDGQQKVMS